MTTMTIAQAHEILNYLEAPHRGLIEAVKLIKDASGYGLKESKDIMDEMRPEHLGWGDRFTILAGHFPEIGMLPSEAKYMLHYLDWDQVPDSVAVQIACMVGWL